MAKALFDWLTQTASNTAGYELWMAAWAMAMTATAYLLARLKGVSKHVLWYLAGAFTSATLLLIAVSILVWSGPKIVLVILGIAVAGAGVYGIRKASKREQARLQGHKKGLVDYKKDFNRAAAHNVKDMARLTKETTYIGTRTAGFAKQLQSAKTDAAQEAIYNRAARTYRSAAVRYRRCAEAVQRSLNDFTDSTTGILGWLEETGNQAQLQTHKAAIDAFRTSIMSANDSTHSYRQAVIEMPSMSQRLNASRAELVESIDISLKTMKAALLFCDKTLGTVA